MVDGPATGPSRFTASDTGESRVVPDAAGALELYLGRMARGERSLVAGAKADHRVMDRMSSADQSLGIQGTLRRVLVYPE